MSLICSKWCTLHFIWIYLFFNCTIHNITIIDRFLSTKCLILCSYSVKYFGKYFGIHYWSIGGWDYWILSNWCLTTILLLLIKLLSHHIVVHLLRVILFLRCWYLSVIHILLKLLVSICRWQRWFLLLV